MKLAFTFTDKPDLSALPKGDIYTTSFELPDSALELHNCKELVLAIAEIVGSFTNSSLHFTCKELGLKLHPIKLATVENRFHQLHFAYKSQVIVFERTSRPSTRQLKILSPIEPVVPQVYFNMYSRRRRERKSLMKNLMQFGTWWCKTDEQRLFADQMTTLADHLLSLLNTETMKLPNDKWWGRGFHPWWKDVAHIDRLERQSKKHAADERKRQKQEERRLAREAALREKGIEPPTVPTTGAGRRPGARPGIFKNVQMRSQLEIRFAAELEERGIRWVYEGEALGDGSYLVDFYLPDFGCWVEVKGRFEARDKQLLPEIAGYLKRERSERLFVYTSSRAMVVNMSGFREIKHDEFWAKLSK